MNNIQMIPIRRLIHHPENPRKDLGDLTELAESIKANGVMQNLTVVPDMMAGTHPCFQTKMEGLENETTDNAG